MGKHSGKGARRSAARRRKEDARWMKLISKNEVISDVVRIAPTARVSRCRREFLVAASFCIAVARRRYFNFIKMDRREDKGEGYRAKLSTGKMSQEKSQPAISDARLRFN